MTMRILGIGTALPAFAISREDNAAAAPLFCLPDEQQARLLPVLFRKAGVDQRYSVLLESDTGPAVGRQDFFRPPTGPDDLGPTTAQRMERYERYAHDLAHRAAEPALAESGVRAEEITHLVTVSCSGFYAPGFDIALMKSLPLSAGVARTHLGFMGCHGAMNGLRVAHAFTQADPSARVLVCATELCSLHYQYGWSPEKIVTNALFGDGAAAAVCAADSHDECSGTHWRLLANGSVLLPDSEDAMTWHIGDHGFEMTLSARVPELIGLHLAPWLERWLAGDGLPESRLGLTLEEVGSWAVHPGGPRILQAVGEALRLPRPALEESRRVLAEHGNMSSPTVLFVLKRLGEQRAPRPCVALGFGPGLVAEAMLLE